MFTVQICLVDEGIVVYVSQPFASPEPKLSLNAEEAYLWESRQACDQWLEENRKANIALFYGVVVELAK